MQGVTTLENKKICPVNPHWNTRFKRYTFADELNDDLRKLFSNAESLLMQSALLKNSRSTTAGIFVLDGKEYFIKRSNVNSLGDRLRRIGRLPRSTRNLLAAQKLEEINILTPKVYMSLETGHFMLPGACYLITEAYPKPITAGDNLEALLEYFNGVDALAEAVCKVVIKMHCSSMTHGDLKMNNILALRNPDGGFKLGLFDLDGVCWHGSTCPEQVIIKELARMASSFCWTARYFNIFDESKFAESILAWSKAYASVGGKDYSQDESFRQRIAKFLPDYNIQELR